MVENCVWRGDLPPLHFTLGCSSEHPVGPCAKTTVTCVITTWDGQRFIGTNACANPQPVCPREPGEGYEKCVSICQQAGHAEREALKLAGDKAVGAHAFFHGHTHACSECQEALYDAGVLWIARAKAPIR